MTGPALRPETCAECRKPVLWVRMDGRAGIVALDTCRAGAGDVAIQVGLLGVEPFAVRVANGSSYREHRCPNAAKKTALSYTGRAPAGKRRP